MDMGRIKPRGRYMAISVPISLHKEITDFVKKSSYNSVAEFVKSAVREKMYQEKLKNVNQELDTILAGEKAIKELIKKEVDKRLKINKKK